jgi:hypothetical protein
MSTPSQNGHATPRGAERSAGRWSREEQVVASIFSILLAGIQLPECTEVYFTGRPTAIRGQQVIQKPFNSLVSPR